MSVEKVADTGATTERPRSVVFAVVPGRHGEPDEDEELAEIKELLRSADMDWVADVIQHRDSPNPRTYLGKGKMDDLKTAIKDLPAAAAALSGSQDCVRDMCRIYGRRRDLLVEALRTVGMHVEPPKGTIYLWVPVPAGYTSATFTQQVLEQADVVVTPGAAYGPSGEGYVRLSLTLPDERLEEAVRRIEERVRL